MKKKTRLSIGIKSVILIQEKTESNISVVEKFWEIKWV